MVDSMQRVKRSQRKALLASMVAVVVPLVIPRVLDTHGFNVFSSSVVFLTYIALISGTYYTVLYFTLDPELRPRPLHVAHGDLGPEEHPAAWYPDPAREHDWRYWDGNGWTEHVSDAGLVSEAPLVANPSARSRSAAWFSKFQYRLNLWTLEHPWLMVASMGLFLFAIFLVVNTVVFDDSAPDNPIRGAIVTTVTYLLVFAPSYRWGSARRRTEASVRRYHEMHP
jgi:hypothetical protein